MFVLERILLGTYTKKTSEGVYEIYLDTDKKELLQPKLVVKEDNPTYLSYSQSANLYAVTKVADQGGIAAYHEKDKQFTHLNTVTEVGAPPCYVTVDEDRQLVYAANYHKGTITSYQIQTDGGLKLVDTVQHTGSGPDENQQGPHAHYADLTPDHRLVACDLGTDEVYTYDIAASGQLTEVARFTATPGTGPRHIVFHPNRKIAYLFGELASSLVVLSYDESKGTFTELQTLSTIPSDHTGHNGGAAIRISKDGKFVYTSNRGHNSVAVFATSTDGTHAELIQHISTEGDFPRDFALDPTEDFAVAANQNTDNLTLYSRDQTTGKLALIQKDVALPECVCVFFTE